MHTLSGYRDAFLHEKRLKNCSEETVKSYYYFIKVFIDHVGDMRADELTVEHLENYALWLYSGNLSSATHHTYLHHLRIFLNWTAKQTQLNIDPAQIVVPKSPKKRVRIYSDDDIRLIYKTDCTDDPVLNARNRALIALMLDSGLRQRELCSIRLQDVDFETGMVKVLGKGKKERYAPLGKVTAALIRKYMELRPQTQIQYLFLSTYGKQLTGNAVKLFVRKMAAELPFEFSSHKLRHNFATNYCIDKLEKEGVVDTYSLMYIMGHESIETTERYVHLAKEIIASKNCISHVDGILLAEMGIA